MIAMRFDWRDIFKAARLAFSFQRLWIQFIGLLGGYASYVVLTYASLLLAGNRLDVLWSRFGLLPCALGLNLPWYSWILFALGLFIFLFFWLVTSTGVARATYMNLKGNYFYTWKEALRFALKKKGVSVILTPVAILMIAFFTGLGGVVIGLLGRIPYVGELGISLFSTIWFMASFFLVFILLALGVSLIMTPAVLATTDDDAFEGIFQSFSMLYSQPWRLIFYEILLLIIALFGFGIFAYFAKQAWSLMTTILIWGMGDKYAGLSFQASYLLQHWVYPAVAWSRMLPYDLGSLLFFTRDFTSMDLPLIMTVSSHIFAFFLAIIAGFIVSYPFAVFNTGNGMIFLILKKKKDDENLLERKDREEEEEEEESQPEEEEKKDDTEPVELKSDEGEKPKKRKKG